MALYIVLLLSLVLAGCRKEEKRTIGVVPKGANHIFWQTVHAGSIAAARESGVEIEWNAPTLEIDSSRQIAIVDSMINRHLAGIALAPVDRKALVGVVERASRAGIPVAIFDSDIDTPQRLTYVSTDNRKGGRLGAQKLADLMGEEGKCAYIGFMPGSAATMEREQGFKEEIAKYPKIRLVQTVYGQANRALAMSSTENIMNAHPDLEGIFADNESSSTGAVLALKARHTSRVRSVMFDASPQLVEDLRDRYIDALVVQDPFKMGYEATHAIAVKLQGQTPPAQIDSGVYLVTRADMEKPDIIPLLFPDISRYLQTSPN